MEIISLIEKKNILFDTSIASKSELFQRLAELLNRNGYVSDQNLFIEALYARETESSTGIEKGFGIPHAKSQSVIEPTIAFAHVSKLEDYIALDLSKVECIFMIAVPEQANDKHLEILSFLARKLMDDEIKEKLKSATNEDEVMQILIEIGG